MARPKLQPEESDCPTCHIPLTPDGETNEKKRYKHVDWTLDKTVEQGYEDIKSWKWTCKKCGMEMTIGKN
jgi:hypothetical protein